MNTQNLLFENSSKMPEGLYLELMNRLKLDFDNDQTKSKVVIINKNLPSTIQISKQEMIQNIIKNSKDWEEREEVLLKISAKRVFINIIKDICISRGLPTMKLNPRWVEQQTILEQYSPELMNLMRRSSPTVMFI